jgi:hypothetical protein
MKGSAVCAGRRAGGWPKPAMLWVCGLLLIPAPVAAAAAKTQNVFLIVSDGLRWQEVFTGAEERLMTKGLGGVKNPSALRQQFWRETPEARREALLPFVWTTIARRGQLFGNQHKGSRVTVTNGKNFSYPGYNEILTGFGDPRIDSNDKKPNPNVTVFEWLNSSAGLSNRVAVFGTWGVFPYIFNLERSRLPIWPAWGERFARFEIAPPEAIAELWRDTTPMWEEVAYDSFLLHAAVACIKQGQPRLVFVGFGETDEWAHAGRYDQYLTAAHHVDRFIRRLWETAQSLPQYRDRTTFIITADHGRGSGRTDWKSHGQRIRHSESDWIAVMGPDTPPLGERVHVGPRAISQIAATVAALLGEDYRARFPQAGELLAEVFGEETGKAAPVPAK